MECVWCSTTSFCFRLPIIRRTCVARSSRCELESLTSDQQASLSRYSSLIHQSNQTQSLTSFSTISLIHEKLVVPSLSLLSLSPPCTLLDLGSGAGIPGIPLSICWPSTSTTLLDSTGRKSEFQRLAIEDLCLSNVSVCTGRAETVAHDKLRECMDMVVCRAVARMDVAVELGLGFVKMNGCMALQKGKKGWMETNEALFAISEMGGRVEDIIQIDNEEGCIVVIRKIKPTPTQYPRRIGVPAKKPLRARRA